MKRPSRPNKETPHFISSYTILLEAYADYLEQERKKDAAIHLQRESELMEQIERLKADLKVQSDGRDSEVSARNIIIKSLEGEIKQLKAERVELVKWVWEEATNLRAAISIEDAESLISEYYNILKQFNKEKS